MWKPRPLHMTYKIPHNMPAAEHPNLLPSPRLLHGLGSGYAALSASYTHQCASDPSTALLFPQGSPRLTPGLHSSLCSRASSPGRQTLTSWRKLQTVSPRHTACSLDHLSCHNDTLLTTIWSIFLLVHYSSLLLEWKSMKAGSVCSLL